MANLRILKITDGGNLITALTSDLMRIAESTPTGNGGSLTTALTPVEPSSKPEPYQPLDHCRRFEP